VKYALAYLRVSTDEQTILNQKLALQKWAKERDFQILDFLKIQQLAAKFQQLTAVDSESYST
jgi:putative DNA-invertase from lambdoid prophage Rac